MSGIIEHLPTSRLTPDVVLHRALGDIENTQAVVLLVQDTDGLWSIEWSQMSASDLCFAEKWLSLEIAYVLLGIEG